MVDTVADAASAAWDGISDAWDKFTSWWWLIERSNSIFSSSAHSLWI
jgi:hypothetical protein